MATLIEIDDATFLRSGGTPAFRNLNWRWQDGETWAIVGDVASGKTSFLDVLLGQLRQTEGSIRWPILDAVRSSGRPVSLPSDIMERVSFKEESRLFSYGQHYYQQRYDFADADDIPTLEQYLRNGSDFDESRFEPICEQLHLKHLLPLTLVKLSNGQTRRARLARGMLRQPEVLLLDEPLIGLDAETRTELDGLLQSLVANGQRIVLATKAGNVPKWVTNTLHLGERQSVSSPCENNQGERQSVSSPCETETIENQTRRAYAAPLAKESIIECRNVRVTYKGVPILRDINWTVRQGERWALLGPNGSGKTTLLSLLCGDHPQAFSNDIKLFGQQRGSGETIWDIKKRIGFVSPELHLYFAEPLSGFEAAATGFHDVLVHRSLNEEQAHRLRQLFAHFEMNVLMDRPFNRMSTGEQRMVLLLRALVKEPDLLIMDEPFQGLDAKRVAKLKDHLETRLRPDQTLIFVSHIAEEIPGNVDRVFRLKEGRNQL